MVVDTVYSVKEGKETALSITLRNECSVAEPNAGCGRHPWHSILGAVAETQSSCQQDSRQGLGSGHAANGQSSNTSALMGMEDITTQGLLDGLEELYDQPSESIFLLPGPSKAGSLLPAAADKDAVETVNRSDAAECRDSAADKQLADMDSQETERIAEQFGRFSSARLGATSEPNAGGRRRAELVAGHSVRAGKAPDPGLEPEPEPELEPGPGPGPGSGPENRSETAADSKLGRVDEPAPEESPANAMEFDGMRGSEALGSIDSMDEFARANAGDSCSAKPELSSAGGDAEIKDMVDEEAQEIISQYGGFLKARSVARAGETAGPAVRSRASLHPHPHPHPRALTPLNSPAAARVLARAAQPTAPVAAPATPRSAVPASTGVPPKMASPFPSRQEVLSARRALKGDAGRPPALSFSTPLGKPRLRLALNALPPLTAAAAPAAAAESTQPAAADTPPAAPPMLAFKSPGLKRQAPRMGFTPPAKRASFAQPFRSPARSADHSPAPLPGRVKPPPKLPPVTVRRQAAASARVQPEARAAATPRDTRGERCGLRAVADEIATTAEQATAHGVPGDALAMTAAAAGTYAFAIGTGRWGWAEARQTLLARGCEPKVVAEAWVRNHFRWSVWAAASYARRLPARWRALWCVEAVLARLVQRYEREYLRGQRSALRRVLEGDASAQQLMVLAVAAVGWQGAAPRLEVTDGWYGVAASADPVLVQALRSGRLRVGDKVACVGLRLSGVSDGVDPLSPAARSAALVLSANCVRRARWDARLGFQRRGAMFMSLSAVYALGGAVGAALDVVVVRSYPMVFREALAGGAHVTRCEREELRLHAAHDTRRAARLQELAEARFAPGTGTGTGTGTGAGAGAASDALLQIVDAEMPPRAVRALFRLLVCDYPAHTYRTPESSGSRLALVTFWAPRGLAPADFPEGRRFLLTGLTVSPQNLAAASAAPPPPLRLNFNASGSRSRPMPADAALVDLSEYRERGALHVDELCHVDACQEVDLIGRVEACSHPSTGAGAGDSSASASGRRRTQSILRLSSPDEHGHAFYAEIAFDAPAFGLISPVPGSLVTVRNCICLTQSSAEPRTFLLRAEDSTEFAL